MSILLTNKVFLVDPGWPFNKGASEMDFHNIGESGIDVAWEEMETEMSLLIEMMGKGIGKRL